MKMTGQDWVLLIFLSLLWGGSFFFAAVAVKAVPPLTLVALRTAIAATALALVLRAQGIALPRGAALSFLAMGTLNNLLPFSLLFWAQGQIPSGLASILNATTPFWAMVIAHLLLADERMTKDKALGMALGFGGVLVLLGAGALHGKTLALWGMLACLAAAVSYGFAGVFGRRFKTMGFASVQVAFGQLTATALMSLPLAALIDTPWRLATPEPTVWAAILALALISTALAYAIFFRLLARVGAVNVSIVTLLVPVSAILLGTLILGERLEPRHFAGMALIAAGLLALDGRLAAKLMARPDAP
jgi:drug/metabolite transporter (DMT)-like permease